MTNYIIIGLLVVILIGAIFLISKTDKRIVVLGQELANASDKEKERRASGNYVKSPMPNLNYSKWPNERVLINPIMNELDSLIINLTSNFSRSNQEQRDKIRNSISQDEIYTIITFSKRATIFGIRNNDASLITTGFTAISMIESERCDYRDVLVALGFLNHGIKKLNLNSKEVYKIAILQSESKTAELITKFSDRSERDKTIETMSGTTEIQTTYGISFVGWNYKTYHPQNNLAKIILEISDYTITDRYETGSISVGDEIPLIWLDAEKDEEIKSTLSKASGCASLHTSIRSGLFPEYENQMLQIYLTEFEEKQTLVRILKQVNNDNSKSYSKLAFIEGNLFCLIVSRSVKMGVTDFESSETLKRFESPIRMIIKKNHGTTM